MKKILLLALVLCISSILRAENPIRFNVEWGYNICFVSSHAFQYRSEDGSMVLDYGPYTDYIGTGFVNIAAGTNFLKKFNVSLLSGIMGICPESKIIPLQLGLAWQPWRLEDDGLIVFAEGGTGFHTTNYGDMPVLMRAGAGWRIVLNRRVSIDCKLSARYILDHPAVRDQSTKQIVNEANVIKNEARFGFVAFSFGVNF